MSNPENKPNLPSINADLAAKVQEKLGWGFPIDDGEDDNVLMITEPTDEGWKSAMRDLKGLSEVDPGITKLQDELDKFLKGENTNE